MPRGDKPTTTAFALKDGWIYEDTLPATLTEEQYDWWFKESLVLDGVRIGPPLADQPPDRAWVKLLSNGELSAYRTDIRTEHRDGRPVYEFSRVSTPVAAPVVDELAYVTRAPVDSQGAQVEFVNNIAAVLDADEVEAFTALIMKAKRSPDLNSGTRSALRSETEIANDAATQMRTACVEKMQQWANERRRDISDPTRMIKYDSARDLIVEIQSLTLDQVKQKEQSK